MRAVVPPGRFELPPPAPEAGALSTELRGRGQRSIADAARWKRKSENRHALLASDKTATPAPKALDSPKNRYL